MDNEESDAVAATSSTKDLEEGDLCPGCKGVIHLPPAVDCSCHINPPCSACTSQELVCSLCGMTQEDWDRMTPDNPEPV